MNIKTRLTIMNFLEFAVWGAYLTSMGRYLGSVGLGNDIPLFYAMQGIVSIFMPALLGIVADRWIPAQRLLGYCHLLASIFICLAGYVGMTSGKNVDFTILFTLYSLSVAFYMPSIALSNSVAYTVLKQNNIDTIKAFPPIRTMGTVGFICSMLFVNYAGTINGSFGFNFMNNTGFESFQNTYAQFFVSGILSLVLFLYSFSLPNCPVNTKNEKVSMYEALGLKAFSLFKDTKMAIFFIFCVLLGVSLQITNAYANPFISSFEGIEAYQNSWGVKNANAMVSLSQISETLCILLIPFFLKRFGIKIVMLMAMVAWVLRFGLFALGDPGTGAWMLVLSMIVYGIAFDFFNVSGSLFVEQETSEDIKSSAQGIFMMMTNGLGATIGILLAGQVVNHFKLFDNSIDTAQKLAGWQTSWFIFAGYSLVVMILFAIIFKHKHNKDIDIKH